MKTKMKGCNFAREKEGECAHREADEEDEGLPELLERVAGTEAQHQANARLCRVCGEKRWRV
jgi:hypothetical protein